MREAAAICSDCSTIWKEEHLTCGSCFSELPTLNDVFLEITGKELRD